MTRTNRLKELRQSKGLTQAELAQKVGVSNQAIHYYENDKREPKNETWQKLSDYFGVSVPYIKGEIDTEQLEKLIELTIFFCFPKVTITYGKEEVDDEFKPFIIIEILSRMLSLLGYCSKDKFLEMYNRVIKLVDDNETIEYLQDFKRAVIQILPKAKGTTENLLNAYENLQREIK